MENPNELGQQTMEWISLQNYLPLPNELVLWYDAMFDQIMYFSMKYPLEHDGDFTHFMRINRPQKYQDQHMYKPLKFHVSKPDIK